MKLQYITKVSTRQSYMCIIIIIIVTVIAYIWLKPQIILFSTGTLTRPASLKILWTTACVAMKKSRQAHLGDVNVVAMSQPGTLISSRLPTLLYIATPPSQLYRSVSYIRLALPIILYIVFAYLASLCSGYLRV